LEWGWVSRRSGAKIKRKDECIKKSIASQAKTKKGCLRNVPPPCMKKSRCFTWRNWGCPVDLNGKQQKILSKGIHERYSEKYLVKECFCGILGSDVVEILIDINNQPKNKKLIPRSID
jgi:hypothetical protein